MFLGALLVAVGSAHAQEQEPAGGKVERDIVFSAPGGAALHLDLYFPKHEGETPAPLAVYLHGGGWRGGSRTVGTWLKDVTAELVARGYVVAAVDYRLVPDVKWPAFIHDVKAAVRFLRANAGKYHIDPDRIGVWGTSAGGHLAALLGTSDASDRLEGDGGNPEASSRVQAVVDLFGPTDLTRMNRREQLAERAFGGVDKLKEASPVEYVTRDDPPFLIIQGDSDKTVPAEQSEILYQRLVAAGAPAKLVIVKKGGHGLTGAEITPTKPELVKMIGDFFDQHLRRPRDAR
jgi:acetyl esterase/lipase